MRRLAILVGAVISIAVGTFAVTSWLPGTAAQESTLISFDVSWIASEGSQAGDTCERWQDWGETRDAGYQVMNIPSSVVISDAAGDIVRVEPLIGTVGAGLTDTPATIIPGESTEPPVCVLTVNADLPPSAGYTITIDREVIATVPETGISGEGNDRPFVVLLD